MLARRRLSQRWNYWQINQTVSINFFSTLTSWETLGLQIHVNTLCPMNSAQFCASTSSTAQVKLVLLSFGDPFWCRSRCHAPPSSSIRVFFLRCGRLMVRCRRIPVWPRSEGAFRQIVCVSWRRRERLSPGFFSQALHCIDIAVIYLKHQLVWRSGPLDLYPSRRSSSRFFPALGFLQRAVMQLYSQ